MKVYLDDVRRAPPGWQRAYTADECIEALRSGNVEELSLDHDLAAEHYDESNWQRIDTHGYTGSLDRANYKEKTGYAVVEWMIENGVWPKLVILHTMNPVGRDNMRRAIERHAPEHVKLEIRVGWRG